MEPVVSAIEACTHAAVGLGVVVMKETIRYIGERENFNAAL